MVFAAISDALFGPTDPALRFIVDQGWRVGKNLGEGAFGKVVKVKRRSDGQKAACKIIELPEDEDMLDAIKKEFTIMRALEHPCIVRCYDCFESPTHYYMNLELMRGGELFDRIIQLKAFSEHMAADVTFQCLLALEYMHSQGIVHRDLKPENRARCTAHEGGRRAWALTALSSASALAFARSADPRRQAGRCPSRQAHRFWCHHAHGSHQRVHAL
jgi:hypothetical protein